jgi:hypothetical protein
VLRYGVGKCCWLSRSSLGTMVALFTVVIDGDLNKIEAVDLARYSVRALHSGANGAPHCQKDLRCKQFTTGPPSVPRLQCLGLWASMPGRCR